jgi:hypothetical protein
MHLTGKMYEPVKKVYSRLNNMPHELPVASKTSLGDVWKTRQNRPTAAYTSMMARYVIVPTAPMGKFLVT